MLAACYLLLAVWRLPPAAWRCPLAISSHVHNLPWLFSVMCETVGLSDDIAGATFMAAGASSPELFASLIGVLTNSAVGAGTVVGSELFNMLVIIGGVCLVTPKPLQLDWRPLSREVFFFSLSLVMVLWVLVSLRNLPLLCDGVGTLPPS